MTRALPFAARPEQLVGVGLVLLSAVGFGSGPFFATIAFDAGMEALPVLFWRFLWAALGSWGFVLLRANGRASLRTVARPRLLVLLALGLFYVGNSGTYVAALQTVSVSLVSMIVYIYPALVAVLATRFLRRLEGRRAWLALGLSTVGVLLAVGGVPGDGAPPITGLALAIASPLIYACWIVLSARMAGERHRTPATVRATIPPSDAEAPTAAGARQGPPPAAAVASALMISATAAGFGALLVLTGGSLSPAAVPDNAWPALISFGVFSAVAIQAFYAGVRRIGGARASLLSTVEPIYTIAIATLILGEILTPVQQVGGVLVIGGVILAETGSPGRRRGRDAAAAVSDAGQRG